MELYFYRKMWIFVQAISKLELLSGNNTVHENVQIQTYSLPVIQVLVLKIITTLRWQTFSKGFSYGKRQEKLDRLIMSVSFGIPYKTIMFQRSVIVLVL